MNTAKSEDSRYWVDHICDAVEKLHPKGDLLVSSGVSPSGPYHFGGAREVLTAEAVVRGMRKRGRSIRHIHFVDAFDALRKRYPYLPESYEAEAGKPLYLVPAPDGRSKSYADQYFSEYKVAVRKLGIDMEIIWTHEEYQKGTFAELISMSLKNRDKAASLIAQVSGRELPNDWQPVQILDESSGSLRTAKYISFDPKAGLVKYLGSDNKEHQADIAVGQLKLDWRLDWPARWKIWGIQVEGFGRDHATKGGSYDTGKAIVESVFGGSAPYPIPYEFINLKGDTKKMSSSLGNLVSIAQVLEIIPPEILRYFTFKSRPDRQLFFDPAIGLYNLIDEYAKVESEVLAGESSEFQRAWETAVLEGQEHVVSTVPFSHLVTVCQTARGEEDVVMELLKRTGHERAVKEQGEAIVRELGYVARWLKKYAPDSVKFELQKKLPELDLAEREEKFLDILGEVLHKGEFKPDQIHQNIYETAVQFSVPPGEAFKLIYRLFLNKDSGPKAGYFLASLDKKFVLDRLARKA